MERILTKTVLQTKEGGGIQLQDSFDVKMKISEIIRTIVSRSYNSVVNIKMEKKV